MNVGGIAVSTQPQPATSRWSVVELPADLPGVVNAIATSPAKADDAVTVLSYGGDDPRALSVVAGVMSDESSVVAPLQSEAGGSPVIDSENQLVGIVEAVSGGTQRVAGIMPTRRHPILSVKALSPVLPVAITNREPIAGTAAIAAFWKPILVPITCAP
jgi:hypothetical protein